MSSFWGALLRRARLRGLVEGTVQSVRAEATESDAKDDAERFQDYGLASNPVDGQGLVINAGGHTIVLRMDRLAERPRLAAMEVAIWHAEGHMVRLKDGKVVQISCDRLVIDAAVGVEINSPTMTVNASSGVELVTPAVHATQDLVVGDAASVGTTLTAGVDVVAAGISQAHHNHHNIKRGTEISDPPS